MLHSERLPRLAYSSTFTRAIMSSGTDETELAAGVSARESWMWAFAHETIIWTHHAAHPTQSTVLGRGLEAGNGPLQPGLRSWRQLREPVSPLCSAALREDTLCS